jgi:hypothetical protein
MTFLLLKNPTNIFRNPLNKVFPSFQKIDFLLKLFSMKFLPFKSFFFKTHFKTCKTYGNIISFVWKYLNRYSSISQIKSYIPCIKIFKCKVNKFIITTLGLYFWPNFLVFWIRTPFAFTSRLLIRFYSLLQPYDF